MKHNQLSKILYLTNTSFKDEGKNKDTFRIKQ